MEAEAYGELLHKLAVLLGSLGARHRRDDGYDDNDDDNSTEASPSDRIESDLVGDCVARGWAALCRRKGSRCLRGSIMGS